jgi:hypothetical protein
MVAVRRLGFILDFFWASIMAFSILLVIDFSKTHYWHSLSEFYFSAIHLDNQRFLLIPICPTSLSPGRI